MDFYEISSSNLESLSKKEMSIYNYILDNIENIQNKTVRALAKECYVSASTILRLVKKLGFTGYSEMIVVIKYTLNDDINNETLTEIPQRNFAYNEEYAKNILETIRVMDKQVFICLIKLICNCKRVYIFGHGMIKTYGNWIEFMFKIKGVDVCFCPNSSYLKYYSQVITNEDVVIIIDYAGNDEQLIEVINVARIHKCHGIISLTKPNKNLIQNLSDYNLYYFVDEIKVDGFDITSNISAIIILELLAHYI